MALDQPDSHGERWRGSWIRGATGARITVTLDHQLAP